VPELPVVVLVPQRPMVTEVKPAKDTPVFDVPAPLF